MGPRAEVAELADAPDSKSGGGNPVWVQVPPSALSALERLHCDGGAPWNSDRRWGLSGAECRDSRGRAPLAGPWIRGDRRPRGLARAPGGEVRAARPARDLRDPAARRDDHRDLPHEPLQDRGRRRQSPRQFRGAGARRAGRDRRRGHPRRRDTPARRARLSGGRRAEDDRQRPLGDRLHLRLRHRRLHLHRGDRPAAHDGREPQPRDGRGGHGSPHGLDRRHERDRRWRRRDPHPGAADHRRARLRRSSSGVTSEARTSRSSSSARATS